MNLNAYKPKNTTEDFLLLVIKNTGKLIQQAETKTQDFLQFRWTRSRESSSFDTLQLESGEWMLGLTSLEVYNSIFTITNENNKIEISKSLKK